MERIVVLRRDNKNPFMEGKFGDSKNFEILISGEEDALAVMWDKLIGSDVYEFVELRTFKKENENVE